MRRAPLGLIVVLVVAIALVPVGAYLLYRAADTQQSAVLQNFLTVSYVVVSFLTTILFSLILFSLVWGILRICYWLGTSVTSDIKVVLPSLAIACLVVPSALSVLTWLLSASFRAIDGGITQLFPTLQGSITACADSSITSRCLGVLGFGLFSAWQSSFSDSFGNPPSAALESIILLLTIWVVSELFLSFAFEASSPARFLSKLYATEPKTRKDFLFFLLLAIAGYLSIAAVAAIPGLQETAAASAAISPDALKQYLDDSLNATQAALGALTVKSEPARDPFYSMERVLEPSNNQIKENKPANNVASKGAVDTKPVAANSAAPFHTSTAEPVAGVNARTSPISTATVPQEIAVIFRILLNQEESSRAELLQIRDDLMQYTVEQRRVGKDHAIEQYVVGNLNRKGARETAEHFLLITKWFDERLSVLDGQITNCVERVETMDKAWRDWSQGLQTALMNGPGEIPESELQQQGKRLLNARSDADSSCFNRAVLPPVPDRPPLGADLGPFRFVASWLLRMESLPLALIVGLLGFGLLGAACSTFVRELQDRQGDQTGRPLVRICPASLFEAFPQLSWFS